MDIKQIPQCDPSEATYMVIVSSTIPVSYRWLGVTAYFKEWEYAANAYEIYRQALKPEFQSNARLVRLNNVIEPGEIMDWN